MKMNLLIYNNLRETYRKRVERYEEIYNKFLCVKVNAKDGLVCTLSNEITQGNIPFVRQAIEDGQYLLQGAPNWFSKVIAERVRTKAHILSSLISHPTNSARIQKC